MHFINPENTMMFKIVLSKIYQFNKIPTLNAISAINSYKLIVGSASFQ
jgi:hypothetical protein